MSDSETLAPRPVPGQPVLAATNVTKQFKVAGGHITAVDDVSVEFHAGKVLAVVGESGSGKSTLARMLLRLMPVTSGTITYNGRDVTHIKGAEVRGPTGATCRRSSRTRSPRSTSSTPSGRPCAAAWVSRAWRRRPSTS